MLRPCRTNPLLSAWEVMEGIYDFDATPMVPPGTEILIHVKPSRWDTWGFRAIKAWYFSPALKHYHCIKAVTDVGGMRISDTF